MLYYGALPPESAQPVQWLPAMRVCCGKGVCQVLLTAEAVHRCLAPCHTQSALCLAGSKLQAACTAAGQKEGGQALLGGLDCLVQRNFFGAQVDSFETQLPAPAPLCALRGTSAATEPDGDRFRAMFIRAPAVLEAGASVEVLAEYQCVSLSRNGFIAFQIND